MNHVPSLVKLVFVLLVVAVAPPVPADTLPEEGKWWKGNLHTHSLWSDGNDFPEMIADWYRSHGYHFLALSDHNVLSEGIRWMPHQEIVDRGGATALAEYRERFGREWVETRGDEALGTFEVRLKPLDEFRGLLEEPGRFLMIPGEEISDRVDRLPVHLNATNLVDLIEPLGGETVRAAIANNLRAVQAQAQRAGREILLHLNHPNFHYAVTAEDLAAVVQERFMEVYNGHPAVGHLGDEHHPAVERLWDIANTIRIAQLKAPPLYGLAVDDSHEYHGEPGSHTGRGWIMVQAAELEAESLIRAIRQGRFYASSGVTLHDIQFDRDEGVLSLAIQPDGQARFTTRFVGTLKGYDAASRPRLDAEQKPLDATRVYSPELGQVLATVEGPQASYRLTGEELYVRAVVTSSRPHPDPSHADQKQQAWTQPVGWER